MAPSHSQSLDQLIFRHSHHRMGLLVLVCCRLSILLGSISIKRLPNIAIDEPDIGWSFSWQKWLRSMSQTTSPSPGSPAAFSLSTLGGQNAPISDKSPPGYTGITVVAVELPRDNRKLTVPCTQSWIKKFDQRNSSENTGEAPGVGTAWPFPSAIAFFGDPKHQRPQPGANNSGGRGAPTATFDSWNPCLYASPGRRGFEGLTFDLKRSCGSHVDHRWIMLLGRFCFVYPQTIVGHFPA